MNKPAARCITASILIVILSTFVPLLAIAGGATTSKLTMKGLKARANGDHTNALLFLDQACTQGDPAGCFVQGVMYVEDGGIAVDKQRARALFQLGCDGKNAAACTNLAIMAETGDGGDKNLPQARELFAKSCNAKQALACYKLAVLLEQNETAETDHKRIKSLKKTACDLGFKDGCR